MAGRVDLQGHRGARGLRPENTIPSFKYAIDQKMTSIEFDVNVTKDKQLIIHHDSEVNSELCLDEEGHPAKPIPIRDLTLAELKKLDCGAVRNESFPEQVPMPNTGLVTLSELFSFVKQYEKDQSWREPVLFFIEIKFREDYTEDEVRESAALVVEAIERADLVSRSTIQSFVTSVHPEIKKLNKDLKTSAAFYISREDMARQAINIADYRRKIINKALLRGVDIISPYYHYVTPEFVRACRDEGLKVVTWTVNDQAKIIEMLECGVDGIISDYPDVLYRVYHEWKGTRPVKI